jgi:RimJ/RimL family protein N-acetyltransferase
MDLEVRVMRRDETALIIDYFHGATPEFLEAMGVDPTRLPARTVWLERFSQEFSRADRERTQFFVIWLEDGVPIGFSSCDKIVPGERANMHLHVVHPEYRRRGVGTRCVQLSAAIYFETFTLRRLFCEPNAFNVGPNRTLQKAGFSYVKTHLTVPGLLNYHQPVTQWVLMQRPP